MDNSTNQICWKCKKEIKYNQKEDEANNDLIPKKIRKVVVDENKKSFPFYAIPKDKQRLVNEKFIQFECCECYVPAE